MDSLFAKFGYTSHGDDLQVNGQDIGNLSSSPLTQALYGIWLGHDSVSPDAR